MNSKVGFWSGLQPYGNRRSVYLRDAYNTVSELSKEATLKWFGEIITYNAQSGEVAYVEFSSQNAVGDKKICNVDVACSLATGCPSIFI